MGIADFFKKGNNKPVTEGSYSYGQVGIDSFFGYSSEITEEEALEIPAVAAAVDIICGAIAQLPFMLVKKNEDTGEIMRKNDDHRLYLLNKQPNPSMDAYTYKRALTKDFLFYGSSNSVIERNLNKIEALYLISSKQISVQVYVYDGYKKYSKTTLNNNFGSKVFDD